MGPILILEDDAATARAIGDVLRSQKFRVLETTNRLDALASGRRQELSLFIAKLELPEMTGADVALELVALYPELPVLITSAYPKAWWAQSEISNYSRFRPDNLDFMASPFSASELMMRVRNLIRQKPYARTGAKNHTGCAA